MLASEWRFPLLLGLASGALAAVLAFLSTYDEYSHHYPVRAPVLKPAIHAAVTSFLFFVVLGLVAGRAALAVGGR